MILTTYQHLFMQQLFVTIHINVTNFGMGRKAVACTGFYPDKMAQYIIQN